MAYFEWAQDMVIDNGPIDEDHRKLVDQVNALHSATTQGRGQDVVAQLLAAVIADTQEHLRREEHLMEVAKFPDLERHKQGHARFVQELRQLRKSTKPAASPWRRSCRRCCATGCRCTFGATTKSCSAL